MQLLFVLRRERDGGERGKEGKGGEGKVVGVLGICVRMRACVCVDGRIARWHVVCIGDGFIPWGHT